MLSQVHRPRVAPARWGTWNTMLAGPLALDRPAAIGPTIGHPENADRSPAPSPRGASA